VNALLVRVGIDQGSGGWNAPVDPETGEFVYVPVPEQVPFRPGMATPYTALQPALASFASRHSGALRNLDLPEELTGRSMHLDPDFERLTYGDNGLRRGRRLADFRAGDVVAFFAGLRPIRPCPHRLIYALIGLYRVAESVRLRDVPSSRWSDNAHTRRLDHMPDDVIVRADPASSGRLRHCIPIGEWRQRTYRVRRDVLGEWGGLSATDGYIQRSAVPPRIINPDGFLLWFEAQGPELVAANNP
jgi:hypothetical protein